MNYRHGFHAGNFADVLKHAVLARILSHLRGKPAPFRVIDTHAGAGRYDLASDEARRGGEWQNGIGRLVAARAEGTIPSAVADLLAPWLDVVGALNPGGTLRHYPGSPLLVRSLLRAEDRLTACELELDTARQLGAALSGDLRVKILPIDGWVALKAYLPPKERRGLVLIDPPFEQGDDFDRLGDGLAEAHGKWATGIFMLWYPVKDRTGPDRLAKRLRRAGIPKVLRAELFVAVPAPGEPLAGNGLLVVNPPWRLERELQALLPWLAKGLARDAGSGHWRLDWLAGEKT